MRATMRWMAPVLGAALVLAACESTTEPVQDSGDVRFTFSGDTTGSFEAVGAITRVNSQTGTYAAGAVQTVPQGRFLSVVGQRATAKAGFVDAAILNVDTPAAGTFTCTEQTADCPFGMVYVTQMTAADEEGDGETVFLSSGGSLTITEITSRRVRGTFTARLEELVFDEGGRVLQVSGSFDVPLLSEWGR